MSRLLFLIGILILFSGLTIFIKSNKKTLDKAFIAFIAFSSISVFADYLFRFNPNILTLQLAYAMATLIPATLFRWLLKFDSDYLANYPRLILLIYNLFTIVAFLLCFITGFIVKDVTALTSSGYVGQVGMFFILYIAYFVAYLFLIYFELYRLNLNSVRITARSTNWLFTGITIYFLISFTCSILFPFILSDYRYTAMDAPALATFIVYILILVINQKLIYFEFTLVEMLIFLTAFIPLTNNILLQNQNLSFQEILVVFTTVTIALLLLKKVVLGFSNINSQVSLIKKLKDQNLELKNNQIDSKEAIMFAAHQLRIPLTVMQGHSSLLLLKNNYGVGNVKKSVEQIYSSAHRMKQIIQDYLADLNSHSTASSKQITKIDLAKLIHMLVDERSYIVKNIKFVVVHDDTKTYHVYCNVNDLTQVVTNLLDNAIKYTHSGEIKIVLKEDVLTQRVQLFIIDTGIGINQEILSKIFKKNYRSINKLVQNSSGSGLGLYYSKKMIQGMNGSLSVSSMGDNKGATFLVEIPKESTS